MARLVLYLGIFRGDPLVSATLAFFAIWLLVTLVQSGLTARIVFDRANLPRRGIYGILLGGTLCLALADGFRIGRMAFTEDTVSEGAWIVFHLLDFLPRVVAYLLIYLTVFRATSHRVALYVGLADQGWFYKKIVDGVLLGIWTTLFFVEAIWVIASAALFYFFDVISGSEYTRRLSTTRSLDSATNSFFIFVHISCAAGIVMLNNARNSQNAQDPVARTLMFWMLPVVAFRAVWTIISTALGNTTGVFKTANQSNSFIVADAFIEQASLAVMIGVILFLGMRSAWWDVPAGVTPQPGSVQQQLYGGQGVMGGQPGMTMVMGPNGLPILGPNGQPIFAPVAPASGQEAWKHQSVYSQAPVPNMMPAYQQQNMLPYGQGFPQQPQFVTPQQQFAHLPQPPAGYSYQPPGVNIQQPHQQQSPVPSLPTGTMGGADQPRASVDSTRKIEAGSST